MEGTETEVQTHCGLRTAWGSNPVISFFVLDRHCWTVAEKPSHLGRFLGKCKYLESPPEVLIQLTCVVSEALMLLKSSLSKFLVVSPGWTSVPEASVTWGGCHGLVETGVSGGPQEPALWVVPPASLTRRRFGSPWVSCAGGLGTLGSIWIHSSALCLSPVKQVPHRTQAAQTPFPSWEEASEPPGSCPR